MSADKDGGTTVWNEDGAGGDETELVPPVTEAGPAANAWSLDDVEDYPSTGIQEIPHSWKDAFGRSAVLLFLAAAAAFTVAVGGFLWLDSHKTTPAAAPTTATPDQVCIHQNDVGCRLPASPTTTPEAPAFSGRYTMAETAEIADGTPAITGKAMVVPCGNGCVDIVGEGGAAGTKTHRASLWVGKWEWNSDAGADCPDGSKSTHAGNAHFAIDTTTLSGTATFTWNKGTCGDPDSNTNVTHILLTKEIN
jgi:hypothetical protein